MSHSDPGSSSEESIYIDLRSPYLAALLAWLCPGAGHLYQRRYGKGVLFLVCILSTYDSKLGSFLADKFDVGIGGIGLIPGNWDDELDKLVN